MKKVIPLLLMLAITSIIVSCGIGNSPKKSAEKFLNAFNRRDFAEARQYATPETNKLVDLMENLTKMSQGTDSLTGKKITIISQRIEGDVAYVTFHEDGSDRNEELKMVKVDGKWLAQVTKQDVAAKDMTSGKEEEEGLMGTDSSDLFTPADSATVSGGGE